MTKIDVFAAIGPAATKKTPKWLFGRVKEVLSVKILGCSEDFCQLRDPNVCNLTSASLNQSAWLIKEKLFHMPVVGGVFYMCCFWLFHLNERVKIHIFLLLNVGTRFGTVNIVFF